MNHLFNRSRLAHWLTALAIGALAGCGGSQAPILGAGGPPPRAPAVISVLPLANAVAVPVTTRTLTVNFSKAMDASTLNATSFTLACPAGTPVAGGVVSYTAANQSATLTLPAPANLPSSTLCTATLSTDIKDQDGIALDNAFVWTFGTADAIAPTVTATLNANGATGVALNTKVGATFSEAMDASTVNASTFLFQQGATPVPGIVAYSGVSAVFTPTSPLASNTRYTATLTTGAKDLAGNALANPYVWSWSTGLLADTTAPLVVATLNANGATGVALNAKAGVTFSEAMDPLTVNAATFTFKQGAVAVPGAVSYSGVNAVFSPSSHLAPSTTYTGTITTGAKDLAGNALAAAFIWNWTTGAAVDSTAPVVILVNPASFATNVAVGSSANASFNKAMDPLTINSANFAIAGVTGSVSYDSNSKIASFVPASPLATGTTFTATVSGGAAGVKDLSGNAMLASKVWTFTTAAIPVVLNPVNLGSASTFGTFGGSAGMTNTGTLTLVNGSIGSIATGSSAITGFHDTAGDIYTESPANIGAVNGKIYSCTNSTTGPTSAGPNAASCLIASNARLDAQTAYLALVAMPPGANPGANLANLTLAPGVYTSPSGSFRIEGGDLTLDAQGNVNAVFVFQMAQTLTVGGPGAAFPQSIVLSGGAQAKNVFWQVGSFATINAAGGGTMVGTLITQAGASFSTAGNVAIVTLNGRALSLGASVTLVDTVINVPAP